jgi:hypothetical protein
LIACADPYSALLECMNNPRPLPPCPPPPNPPLPPNCSQGTGVGNGVCERITECPNVHYFTECYDGFDETLGWGCNCYLNGEYRATVNVSYGVGDACRAGAAYCGFP